MAARGLARELDRALGAPERIRLLAQEPRRHRACHEWHATTGWSP